MGLPECVSKSHAGSVFQSCQQSVQAAHTLHRRGYGGTDAAVWNVPPSCEWSGNPKTLGYENIRQHYFCS